MGYRYSYGNTRRHGRQTSSGHRKALEHIEQARRLSIELGGTDRDVKAYLFALSPGQLDPILREYGRQFGADKESYARWVMPKWRTGHVQMSGLVAERLFKMLPRFMPLGRKYCLVERLWEKYSPRSEYTITFGRSSSLSEITARLDQHLAAVVKEYEVPDPLQHRFNWLADGDAVTYQTLLNHFLLSDKEHATESVRRHVELILARILAPNSLVQGFHQEVNIGGHKVTLMFEPNASEVRLERGTRQVHRHTASGSVDIVGATPASAEPSEADYGAVLAVLIVITLIGILIIASSS